MTFDDFPRKVAWKLGYRLTRRSNSHSTILSGFAPADEAIAARVTGYTMTSALKRVALITAVRHVVQQRIPGDIVECGVWKGGGMMAAAFTLLEEGDATRDLHLFDTFEGMPPPEAADVRADGEPAANVLATSSRDSDYWAIGPIETVRSGMASTGYPSDLIHYVVGKVEDTLPAHAPDRIAILRLDTDWRSSTLHELEHLYDRLVPGGVLIIDDYGYWRGSQEAVDDFFSTRPKPLLCPLDDGGRIAVKPHSK